MTMKKTLEAMAQEMIHGWQTTMPSGSTNAVIGGKSYTAAQVIALFQGVVDGFQGVRDAQAAAHRALIAREASQAEWKTFYEDTVVYLKQTLGRKSPLLADFGIVQKVPKKPSAETRAIAKVRKAATRKVRGTIGPKQRAEIVAGGRPQVIVLGPDGKPLAPPAGGGTSGSGTGNGA
ncbi:MAG: hypothetical protein ACYCWW_20335 [Deltaproteobacteria bacterium]